MDPELLKEKVRHFTSPWVVVDKTEVRKLISIAECGATFLQHRAEMMVREAGHRPVLVAHLCDGWGCSTDHRSRKGKGSTSVMSHTRYRDEYLLQRMVVRSSDGCDEQLAMALRPPIPLEHGRTAWHVCDAIQRDMLFPRELGHRGIAIIVYCQDGALISPCLRKMKVFHQRWYVHGMPEESKAEIDAAKMMELVIGVKCLAHCAHNALRWGIFTQHPKELSDEGHLAIKSLIETSTPLHSHIDEFLRLHLGFRAPSMDSFEEEEFWKFLGVGEDWLPLLCSMQPHWDGDTLWLSSTWEDRTDMWEQVVLLLSYAWRWTNWSDTRWMKAGKSGRRFLLSLECGLAGQVEHILEDPNVMPYRLHGFKRATVDVKLFFLTCSFCAVPCEEALINVCADDRTLRHAQSIKASVEDKYSYLSGLSDSFYARMIALVGCDLSPAVLKNKLLTSTLVSMGYMHREIFALVEADPLAMTQGDITENIRLLATRNPSDPVTIQMKQMVEQYGVEAQLAEALRLLRDAPMSTAMVEEGHACGHMIMKEHPTMSKETMLARSCLAQMRPCFSPSFQDRQLARLDGKLARLRKKLPQKMTDRNMLVKLLADDRKSKMDWTGDATTGFSANQDIVKQVSVVMHGLDETGRLELSRKRQRLVHDKQEGIAAAQAALIVRQAEWQQEWSDHYAEVGRPNLLREIRFTEADLEIMSSWLDSKESRQGSASRWASMLRAPRAPPRHEQKAIEDEARAMPQPVVEQTQWFHRYMVHHREQFKAVAIGRRGHHRTVYLFLFARAGAYNECTFLQLRRRDFVWPSPGDRANPVLPWHQIRFWADPPRFCSETQLPFHEDDELFLLHGMKVQGTMVISPHTAERMESFMQVRQWPQGPAGQGAGPRRDRQQPLGRDAMRQFLLDHPWLTEDDLAPRASVGKSRDVPRHAGGGLDVADGREHTGGDEPEATGGDDVEDLAEVVADDPTGADDPHDGVDLAEVAADLLAIREEVAVAHELVDEELNFVVKVLGGAWTRRHHGVSADNIGMFARTQDARRWCLRYGFPRQRTFAIRMYTRHGASTLSHELARRGNYFMALEPLEPLDGFMYTRAMVASYVATAEWADFVLAMAGHPDATAAATQVEHTAPNFV